MKNFKSLPQLLDHFKDEKTCIAHFEKIQWNGKPVCPFCKSEKKPYKTNRGYKCSNNECNKKFTVKVGTIFENSKIPFRIWFGAIYLATASKKGISSVQLEINLGITQKTAWFVLHRVREMLAGYAPTMLGENKVVEGDATFIGGKEKNKHFNKRIKRDIENPSPTQGKKAVFGLIERDGKVLLKYIPAENETAMLPFIQKHVPEGTRIITDEHNAYKSLNRNYVHDTINHNVKVYVVGDVHTNTIECFWSVLKRGLYGVYHQVSAKHLDRYLHEFAGRFNTRQLGTEERFDKFLAQSEGRLLYKNLIAKA